MENNTPFEKNDQTWWMNECKRNVDDWVSDQWSFHYF